MKKINIKVPYDDVKLKAITSSTNKEIEHEIINFLDGLYDKNVPPALKKFIGMEEKNENKKVTVEKMESNTKKT